MNTLASDSPPVNPVPFIALCGAEFVDVSLDLDALLTTVRGDMEPGAGEDVAIWQGQRLVVVLHADGTRTDFRRAR